MTSLHAIPIKQRPPPSIQSWLHFIAFNIFFSASMILIHSFQLFALPLLLIPHPSARTLYVALQTHAKEAFTSDLILITHWFGPTRLVLTADESVNLEELVRRNERGEVVGFRLAKQAVWMSNHQMYADWIYPWILQAFAGVSSGLIIILKASLEWAPLVGPAMQLFHFCFISKSKTLAKSNLFRAAKEMRDRDVAYHCLVFPEGTLYSRSTRPRSAKYAQTSGIPDAINVLLPRSTGLLYTLRCLSTVFTPSKLTFYDLTVGYPGVPAQGYAQNYYTLQTIYGRRVPPPTVHMHFRQIRLEVLPLGTIRPSARPQHIAEEVTSDEKQAFDLWLRNRWEEKDRLMGQFGATGEFDVGMQGKVVFDIRMRRQDWVTLASIPVGLTVWILLAVKVVGFIWR
ncbi:lysophosphatidic acid acyltransferase / lysophosphatidylinositol acyltransferase [Rhodotorula toruloides]|uniref:Lysophosphatidic acid acyltransferase n=1 Tax=Rhodotorula toruloides TaxID=5286 RepID=A0A2Z6EYW7_RHOTO|nr:lysophosphatidic acid acyltransferase [Rhodotorula toruloides]GEM08557.1 lysophosphatidic acid acyltransferase / lysophosphatidylinositol acyltransferase [Rhodotorula toruloides]